MKNKNLLKLIVIFVIGFTMLTSCSSDDDSITNTNNSSLFDKWWYDSNNVTADIYFHADGQYEQKIILLGNEITGTGNWTWENESSGIMKIDNLGGNGQVVSSVWFKFSDILNNTVTIQQSTNGTDYSIEVFYQDTDN
ncbi:hypothetical protein [Neotamlana laminarinivorans]|uniref:Lipocalin-like domain-containing protein n=1 Tax=Neotamlana laminarinivorans TaxID=2883124 RepID=A0A9X1I501_9FLAO|nr:hypothetical protein [Tamlana laminarinivorans]MCB4800094.1 hypothetical protein [Tamlana laminarinivorans]